MILVVKGKDKKREQKTAQTRFQETKYFFLCFCQSSGEYELNFYTLFKRGVARERRRGDRTPTKNKCNGGYISGQCRETRNSLSLSSEKLCGSRHLVFWSLGTLTGLRD